jgi:diguanylate cyclase (GGDEF)-like protein/PAS domain S-box-containing protein
MGTWLASRRALAGYAVLMALLVAVHYAVPEGRALTTALVSLGAVAAIVAGAIINGPARRAPWLLLAAANLTGALGELAGAVQGAVSHAALPFPSFADAVYLLEFPFFVAALALFIQAQSSERDLRSVVDALILTVGFALLCWLFLVIPGATNPDLSWTERLVSIAYPVGDMLVLLTLARLLAPGTVRGASAALLAFGTIAGIASDVAYDLVKNSGDSRGGPLLTLGWLVGYIALGAAALHPSMTELTEPARQRIPDTAPGSVVVLLLASLIPPVFLLIHSFEHRDGVEGVVAVACAVLYLLMLSRLWDVAITNRRSLLRERTLRMASAALASAGSVAQVAAAVRDAASTLIPGVPDDRAAMLTIRDGDYLRQVDPSGAQPADPPDPVSVWLKLAEGRSPKFVSVTEMMAARFGVVPGAPPPDTPVQVSYEGALLCPLTLKDRPVGDPFIGLLAFFGDRQVLRGLTSVFATLAGQVTLAVERLELSAEVVRQRGEALFRTLVQDASDVIIIIDDDRRVRYATPSASDLFGISRIEGRRLVDLVAPSARDDVDRVVGQMLLIGTAAVSSRVPPGYLLQVERLDGRMAVLEVRWSDLRHEGTVGGLVLTLRDVTAQHELSEELKRQAYHDALTGLPNRAYFTREAAAALEAAHAVGRTAGVLFVDLDDFKVVNDTMGHSVGDELLVAVAARLASSVRQSDTAARLGGDEFALLIDDAADPEAVNAFAERIVAAFNEPFTLQEAKVLTSATVGVATSEDSRDVDQLLRHADLALYAAKTAGKRRWRHYQPALTSGMLERRELQAALEDAVKTHAFTLVYQPIVSLESGQIAGFESLLRWPHQRRGMMLPGQFIGLAEETGLIVPLGAWALRQALSDMARWRQSTGLEPHVSVNVSARQFRDPGFAEGVRHALHASGLPASALLLELTESLFLGGSEQTRADMNELKDIGVKLAIDDFGTGYSSLSYLLDLPIDVLKIDKSFVTGISSSWRRHALVEGIVRLARTLEVEVIAEGIETETERELLAGMGCQFGQGYLLSVPVDAAAAAAMLRRRRGLVAELPQQPRRKSPDGRYITDL